MRKWKKIILCACLLLLVIVSVLIFQYRELVAYGWMQAKGQWKIVSEARPLEVYLESPFTEKYGEKVKLIKDIKSYAADSLGLDTTRTYNSLYVPKEGEEAPTMWVVSAAYPFQLKAYTWSFPLIGDLPYKGFFDKPKAEATKQQLTAAGYDTRLGRAAGWSTLGWIENPLLASMLERSDAKLTELLIHELTHNTIYMKHNTTFNENIASLIGYEGTLAYLQASNRLQDKKNYINYMNDYKIYYTYLIKNAKKLDKLYKSFSAPLSIEEKKHQKQRAIRAIICGLDTLSFRQEAWKKLGQTMHSLPNNTFFMSYLRYRGKHDSLRHELIKHSSLRSYIEVLKARN